MDRGEHTDEDLWRLAASDPEAFGELFRRHARAIRKFCARRTGDLALADDLTSVVFLEAWRRRKTVRFAHESALPWLFGVANNVVRNSTRSLRRHRHAIARIPEEPAPIGVEDSVVQRVAVEASIARASEALVFLTRSEREVFMLVFWDGLTYEEAAVALRIPIGTVRSRLSRGRAKLNASLSHSPPELLEVLK